MILETRKILARDSSLADLRLEDEPQAVLNLTRPLSQGRETYSALGALTRDDVVARTAGRVSSTGIGYTAVDVGEDLARPRLHTIDKITAEVGMVENVEEVEPELEAQFLAPQPPVLVDRQVGIDIPRSTAVAARLRGLGNRADLVPNQRHRLRIEDLRTGYALAGN